MYIKQHISSVLHSPNCYLVSCTMLKVITVAFCLIQAMDCQAPGRVHRSCDETISCGSAEDGWRSVANLDMSETGARCPSDLHLHEKEGVQACGRPKKSGDSCSSVSFASGGTYNEVCGRVVGYQYGHSGGINPHPSTGHSKKIKKAYLDGVSITKGSPRTHIWSFITANNEGGTKHDDNRQLCPCSEEFYPRYDQIPEFVGDDWFCESGAPIYPSEGSFFYNNDKLWDGEQCSDLEPCCNTKGQPWFHKVFDTTSSEDIELRVCDNNRNTGNKGSDTLVALYEIYVR